MKLTESKLRQIIREEASKLISEKKVAVADKASVRSNFPSTGDGKVHAYDEKNDRIQKVSAKTAEEKDRYRKPTPEELEQVNELKKVVRQEIAKAKKQMNELSFREDKMRELLSREPKLERIRQEAGHDLKRMFNQYVKRNKELKRRYKQASPQPQGG